MRFGWVEVMGLYISMVMWSGKCVRGGDVVVPDMAVVIYP